MTARESYIDKLREHFEARRQRNPAYSLRSFARDLNWSPSRLSEALNGKAGLSLGKAESIAERLSLSPVERELFTAMVAEKHARTKQQRESARTTIQKIRQGAGISSVSLESFKVIRDWYHLAIVELLKVRGFQSSAKWISKRLRLPLEKVIEAIERLKQIGLLKEKDGHLIAAAPRNAIGAGVPSDAIKNFHTQILHKAIDAIYGQSVDQRHLSASIVAINKNDLPKICARIVDFRRQLCAEFGSGEAKDSLYCISTQCFSLEEGVVDG